MTNGCMDITIKDEKEAVKLNKIANEYDEDINIYVGDCILVDAKSIISVINLIGMPNVRIKMLAYELSHEKEFYEKISGLAGRNNNVSR